MMRFFEYDYGQRVVIEYERLGECNQCGVCCQYQTRFMVIKPGRARNIRNGGGATDGEGIWQGVFTGRWAYYFKLLGTDKGEPCPSLQGTLCVIHGEPRQHICTFWPIGPRCVEPFPQCSYTFREIGRWPLEVAAS